MVIMPDFNWKYSYPLKTGNNKYLAVVIEQTLDIFEEDLKGVSVKFKGPAGQIISAPINSYYGLEDDVVLLFSNVTAIYKPIGFVDVEDDVNSFEDPVWIA